MTASQTRRGWTFRSPHTLEQMKHRLDAAWPRPWSMGDSERLGDYLGGRLTDEAVARIYATGVHLYTVVLRFYSLGADTRAQLQLAERRLFDQALVLVDAVEITSTEPLD